MLGSAICGRPLIVPKEVINTRVYFRRPNWEDDEPDDYMQRSSVVFICDTQEEAQSMYELSEQRRGEIATAIGQVEAKYEALIRAKLAPKEDPPVRATTPGN